MENKLHRIFTIPNILSVFRIILIPVFIWLYCGRQQYLQAASIIVISAATDIIDGYIARHFDMITDVGKVLDPIADKLTQAAIIICLASRFRNMWILFCLLAVKEITMGLLGLLVIKRTGAVHSSKWYGKLSTAVLYGVMLLHVLIPGIPDVISSCLICLCAALLLMSLTMYTVRYVKML